MHVTRNGTRAHPVPRSHLYITKFWPIHSSSPTFEILKWIIQIQHITPGPLNLIGKQHKCLGRGGPNPRPMNTVTTDSDLIKWVRELQRNNSTVSFEYVIVTADIIQFSKSVRRNVRGCVMARPGVAMTTVAMGIHDAVESSRRLGNRQESETDWITSVATRQSWNIPTDCHKDPPREWRLGRMGRRRSTSGEPSFVSFDDSGTKFSPGKLEHRTKCQQSRKSSAAIVWIHESKIFGAPWAWWYLSH